jgi:D-alanine-D-alanine ligase
MAGLIRSFSDIKQDLQKNLQGPVAVLLGGKASERAVSLKSGNAVLEALRAAGVDAHPIDTQDDNWLQAVRQFPHAFIALHGPGGEDGIVQSILEELNISYTGSAVLASALGMDKLRTKQLWQGVGLSTPAFTELNEHSNWSDIMQRFGAAMVKPAHEGSSIGMARVTTAEELQAAFFAAAKYDTSVIAEQWIAGAEFTVAILGDRALPSIRLETSHSFYDFDAKYLANDTRYLCPCGLDEEKEKALQVLALKAFEAVGCRDWGRVDVMQNQQGEFFLLEVNTVPGMTDHSLVPMAAKVAGMDFNHLVAFILLLSVSRKNSSGEAA